MAKVLPAVLLALLLAIPLAACGGDDDEPAATTANGGMPSSSSSTSTTGDPAEAVATETTKASPDASPTAGEFTDDEAALIDLLLSAEDLTGDWDQLRLEAPELEDSPGICDAPRFSRAVERVAEVEVEYQSTDGARFVLENLTQFPEDVAVEAMAYVRETATCSEWTDDTGTVFQISPAEAPEIGDESYAIHVAFQVADAGKLEGEFVYFRIASYVTIVTTLTLNDYDQAFSRDTATLAASKIDSLVGTGNNVTDEEAALMTGLLTLDQFDEDWDQPQPAHRSDPADWTGLCDAELFPDSDKASARVAVEFFEGFEPTSASLMQLLVAYPTDIAEAAFDYEQQAASCGSFTGGGSEITLEQDSDFPTLGDESFAVHFKYGTDDNLIEGYWIVFRVGDELSTLIYTDPDELSVDDVTPIATSAANQVAAR